MAPDDDDDLPLARSAPRRPFVPMPEPELELELEPAPSPPPRAEADDAGRSAEPDGHPPLAEVDQEALAEHAAEEASAGTVRTRPRGLSAWLGWLRPGGQRRKYTANRWDSPLLLVGGGALLLLLILAVGLWFYLARGTGDDAFNLAYDDYRAESYGQAVSKFEQFLRDYPDHPKAGLARVRIGLANLWNVVTRKEWEEALRVARSELPKIESEPDFNEARAELASLLPEIADGFAELGLKAENIPAAQKYLDLAGEAFKEIENSAYLPTSVRSGQQPRIEQIRAKLQSVERRINRDQQLEETVTQIQTAAQAGQIAQAYDLRSKLLREYPGLETDARLAAAVQFIAQQEQVAVQPLAEPPVATTDDRPSTAQFRVALAYRRGPSTAEIDQQTVCVLARGAVYGLKSSSGALLWRRFVGFECNSPPVPLGAEAGAAVLVVDAVHQELLCLELPSGKLLWRLPCGGPPATPVVAGGRAYVASGDSQQGRLLAVNLQTGAVASAVTFPEPLTTGPVVDVEQGRLAQPALHSSLYLLDSQDLSCRQVLYLGHAAGTVVVPPVLVLGQLLVAENAGTDFCLLHLLGAHPERPEELQSIGDPLRLEGRVVVPMTAFGQRALVVTDRGRLYVFELDPNNLGQPIRAAVTAVSTVAGGALSYPLLSQSRLWVGDSQLTHYELQISRGQLVRKWINSKGDVFLGPLQRQGDVLFHLRRRVGRLGATVAATRIDSVAGGARDGEIIWETDLGVPPAGPPTINRAAQQIQLVSGNGVLLAIDNQAIRDGVLDQPRFDLGDPRLPPLQRAVAMSEPRVAYSGLPPTSQLVILDPDRAEQPLRPLALATEGDVPAALPAAFQNGLLLPTRGGRVQLFDVQSGRPAAHAYQPPLPAGAEVKWQTPAVTEDGQQALLIDGSGTMFRIALKTDPQPQLVAELQVPTSAVPLAAPAVLGPTVFVATRGVGNDRLMAFGLEDLQPGSEWDLPGRLTWGPCRVGDLVLVATDADQLWGLEQQPEPRWKVALPYGRLVGEPLVSDQSLVLASVRGTVWQISGQTGEEQARVEIGEPLGTGPVQFSGNRLLVCGDDGTIHVINLPPR